MKGKMVFGALFLSAALCSQGFGFELLANMVGLTRGGCGPCGPACCDQAAECCAPEPCCCEPRCTPVRDLFAGLKDLLCCKLCCEPCCEPACCEKAECCAPEPACCEAACCKNRCKRRCCEPKCCEADCCKKRCKRRCCKPACCEAECCEPECGKPCCKKRCRPLLDLLDNLFCCNRCCKPSCCEPSCCGAAAGAEEAGEAAPLPIAPAVDPSATLLRSRTLVSN